MPERRGEGSHAYMNEERALHGIASALKRHSPASECKLETGFLSIALVGAQRDVAA